MQALRRMNIGYQLDIITSDGVFCLMVYDLDNKFNFLYKMKKDDVKNFCLEIVANEVEISNEMILSQSKSEDVVDARHLLVMLMYDIGLYPTSIAKLMGCTVRNINVIISGFSLRCQRRKLLRNSYEKLRKYIGNNCLTE